ncbi:MAG: hypothetical protein NVSMB69_13080 [Novosphingobium sp.]
MRYVYGSILAGALFVMAMPLHAQDVYGPANVKPEDEKSISERAAEADAREKALLEDPGKRCKREAENSREIVVCADPDKNNRDRLPLRKELDSAKSTRTGVPRAPDVYGLQHKGIPLVTFTGCMIPPCPPPPILYIDLKAIPEAPLGSDADRIGKGEIPAP